MTFAPEKPTTIIRTERGLTISGSRATLYDVIDFRKANYPTEFIRNILNLTEAQVKVALDYLENNCSEIESEYQEVLATREDIRQYWETRNSKHFAEKELMLRPLTKESILSRLKSKQYPSMLVNDC